LYIAKCCLNCDKQVFVGYLLVGTVDLVVVKI